MLGEDRLAVKPGVTLGAYWAASEADREVSAAEAGRVGVDSGKTWEKVQPAWVGMLALVD